MTDNTRTFVAAMFAVSGFTFLWSVGWEVVVGVGLVAVALEINSGGAER